MNVGPADTHHPNLGIANARSQSIPCLQHFAAWKNHIGLYPPVAGDAQLQKAVEPYAGPTGNLQFPLDRPIPYDLIARIVGHRVKQDAASPGRSKKRK